MSEKTRTSEEFWQSISDRVAEPARWKSWQVRGTTFLGGEAIERYSASNGFSHIERDKRENPD